MVNKRQVGGGMVYVLEATVEVLDKEDRVLVESPPTMSTTVRFHLSDIPSNSWTYDQLCRSGVLKGIKHLSTRGT